MYSVVGVLATRISVSANAVRGRFARQQSWVAHVRFEVLLSNNIKQLS
jgi:hypothetical protein